MRRSRPALQDGDKEVLRMKDRSWVDQVDQEAETYDRVVGRLTRYPAVRDPYEIAQAKTLARPRRGGMLEAVDQPYEEVDDELLEAVPHTGKGYINPTGGYIHPSAGYINPTAGGAEFQPDLSNAHAFYQSLYAHHDDQMYASKKMGKLFGSGYASFMRSKSGSGRVKGGLRWGHLLAPAMRGHIKKALKGTGVDPEVFMAHLEEHPMMEKRVTRTALGGNVFKTIWQKMKEIFTSETAKKLYATLGKAALEALVGYVGKQMKGDEPEVKGGYATMGGAEEASPVPVDIPIPKVTAKDKVGQVPPTPDQIKEAKAMVRDFVKGQGLHGGSKADWYAFWRGFKDGFVKVWTFLLPIVKPLIGIGMKGGSVMPIMEKPRRSHMVGGPDSLPPWIKEGIPYPAWRARHTAIGEDTGLSAKKNVRGGSWRADL